MVLMVLKLGEQEQFLYETTTNVPLSELIPDVCDVHNQRIRIAVLCHQIQELAKHGPAKQPDKQGLDGYTNEKGHMITDGDEVEDYSKKFANYQRDPLGMRTGDAPSIELATVLTKQVEEAMASISEKQISMKKPLDVNILKGQIELLKGAVKICYPMDLPQWDPVVILFMDTDWESHTDGAAESKAIMQREEVTLWWAGKQLQRTELLSKYVGKNEKTKIIAKLQRKGGGAPAREPVVDKDTQKNMMSFYYKKQEEMKKLQENDDDDYVNSSWANSNSLKQQFTGMGPNIRFR